MKSILKKPSILYLFFSLLIVFISWLRWFSTGSLRADENYIVRGDAYVWIYVLGYLASFWSLVWVYYKIVFNQTEFSLSILETKRLSQIALIVFYFMTVMFASDVYSYLAEGELATRGIFTYTDGTRLSESRFIDYISHWWRDCPNHYGPPLLLIFFLSVKMGGSMMGSYFVLKTILLIISLLFVEVLYLIFQKHITPKLYNVFAFIVLAPLFMIEGLGQTHVEIFIVLLTALSIHFFLNEKHYFFILFIALAISCKIMYSAVLIPFVIALYYSKFFTAKQYAHFFRYSLLSMVGIICIIGVSYIPVWEGIETITNPVKYHGTKTPSRSFTEITILVYKFGGELIQNGFDILGLLDKAHQPDFFPKAQVLEYQKKVAPIFAVIGLLLAIWNLIPLWDTKKPERVLYFFAKLWIIVITVYSPIFNPWYFMPVLLFLIFTSDKSWLVYGIFVISQSINGQLGNSTIPPKHILEIVSSIQVLIMAPLFLVYFRKHFILETWLWLKK